jgi:formylglycine-generating enzyme required for sulfatase activity
MSNSLHSSVSRRNLLRLGGGIIGTSLLGRAIYKKWVHHQIDPLPSASLQPIIFEFITVKVDDLAREVQRQTLRKQGFIEHINRGFPLELVPIPAGRFLMGSPSTEFHHQNDETPQHIVEMSPFLIGRYPITQAQWKTVAFLPKIRIDLDPDPSYFKGINRPVEQVSWEDSIEFCQRLSKYTGRLYRLPSEAEWEYACRAGTKTPFYFGPTASNSLVNYCGIEMGYDKGPASNFCYGRTTNIGLYPANIFGLCDTHGNVYEWCMDAWHEDYHNAPTNGEAWVNSDEKSGRKYYFFGNRVIRGGSWFMFVSVSRSAARSSSGGLSRSNEIGLRVVLQKFI